MRKALVVGIDDYKAAPLHGCVNDALAIGGVLETNGDGSPNFSAVLLTSDSKNISCAVLGEAIADLFKGDADTALLFFAGHGIINPATNAGYIVTQDGHKGAWGVSLSDILAQANAAYPRIKSTVIILDSCQSGYAGEIQALGTTNLSAIATGVTILTACHREGTAGEIGGHGLFTSLLLEGLRGTSADVCGRITPASVYSLIDQTLGPWEQRPIYKANVQSFVTLRTVAPKIPLETLRHLPIYFPNVTDTFALDPSFEPDRENVPQALRHIPANSDNARVFKELQACNRHGLVAPVDAEHMYYAAINSTGCKLTALGAHYRKLAAAKLL
jgi:hypothetical protein